ncbi:MAG TPA: IS982 family transposase [Allocoleopsis sp.]
MLDEIYYEVDEFCKTYSDFLHKLVHSLGFCRKSHPCSLSLSEVMTILIYYHYSDYRHFKAYYTKGILGCFKSDFPKAPSYNRFVEFIPRAFLPLLAFVVYRCSKAQRTGIYFLDSTKLPVSFITRAHSHKVFRGFVGKSKTSTGWFLGLKLHLVINNLGELVHFYLSSGNKADSDAFILFTVTKNLFGMFYTDAGYQMSEEKRLLLELDRLRTFIVKPRSNMKNAEKPLLYKDVLWHKKRPTIESVIDIQKEHLDLKLNRQRSAINGFTTVFANLAAYSFYPDKPSAAIQKIYELKSGENSLKVAA